LSWYVSPSLERLKAALDKRWPKRDRTSDGSIGDASHQSRVSDHNPDADGSVNARDVDKDGIHVPTVIAAAILHPSTTYVIYRRRIWSRTNGFRPVYYGGSNPHTGHLHVSIAHTKAAENSTAPWPPIDPAPAWGLLRKGATGSLVKLLQAYLNGQGASLVVDGIFGPKTDAELRDFQHWAVHQTGESHNLVDGIAGPITRRWCETLTRSW